MSTNFLSRNILSRGQGDFCRITPKCFKPNSKKVLQLFIAIENGALALETEEQIKLNKNKIRFDQFVAFRFS